MFDAIKVVAALALSSLLAYLQPVYNAMFVVFFIFTADMLLGISADIFVNRKRLNARKFIFAFLSFMIYTAIIASVYVIGEHMDDKDESLFVVKWLTYSFIYFYAVNILKNLRFLFPNVRTFAFLEFTVGLEFLKRIPALSSFLEKEKENSHMPKSLQVCENCEAYEYMHHDYGKCKKHKKTVLYNEVCDDLILHSETQTPCNNEQDR